MAWAVVMRIVIITVMMMWVGILGDLEKDRAECGEALVGLATCIPYAEGSSKSPTPDCCAGLKQVSGKSPKCLCVLVKDRNEPDLGFKIDVTRVLSLPDICSVPAANISLCPKLLNLAPGSKEAQVFEQLTNTTHHGGAPSGPGKGMNTTGQGAATGSTTVGSGGVSNHLVGTRGRWFGVEIWTSCALILSLIFLSS